MSRNRLEKFKSMLIAVLITAGIVQVGILWEYQSQGTPTSFIMRLFGEKNVISDTVARQKLFVPDRMILSNGKRDHWVIDTDTGFYEDLWEEAKQGLKQIATGNYVLNATNEDWGNVVENRGFIVEFGYVISPDLMRWFLGLRDKHQELPEVYKLMVKPDIVNENLSTFYLCTPSGTVYVSGSVVYERERTMDSIFSYMDENSSQKYRNYYTFRGSKIDKSTGAQPDVLHVISSPSYWPYYAYSSKPPAKAMRKEDLADVFLGNDKDRYNKSMNAEGTVQFNYGSNVYRYYKDGYMTYQYLGSADASGKSGVGEALFTAYQFIADISELMTADVDIRLTNVKQLRQGVYSFGFDYRLKELPVRVQLAVRDGEEELLHAIEIQADGNRVLKCNWFMRDLIRDARGYYNDRFWDLDLVRLTGLEHEQMNIQDMHPGYFISSTEEQTVTPQFLIDMKDGSFFALEMPAREGD
jgi:hypothetical protein